MKKKEPSLFLHFLLMDRENPMCECAHGVIVNSR